MSKITRTPHVPGVRHDFKTDRYVPTINGRDMSPSFFYEERAWELARSMCSVTTQHTPEPWDFHMAVNAEYPRVIVYAVDGGCTIAVIGDKELDPDCLLETDAADAMRIVGCVNACKGIKDPSVVPELLAALINADKLITQLMPGIKHIVLQDYGFLNETLLANTRAIARAREGKDK